MRIRTIKPAFWSNEKMARLPDRAKLLAIGLLNYADDEGYFWANPKMIRGALFPFDEDSTNVQRGLDLLSAEGYVITGKTPDGRAWGKVVNFSKHQRVDRPQASEIKPIATIQDDSSNDLRMLDDQSLLDRKGMEGKGKEINTGASARTVFVVPTAEQVTSYSQEIGYPMDGQAWCDSYAQKGWMIGKSKMKDWRAAVRNWKRSKWIIGPAQAQAEPQRLPENVRLAMARQSAQPQQQELLAQ